ncbi:MAG TPA: LPS export ABC transporter periplasmic protein LptC, partial [Thermoanaerobaculia bacterium]|nr:LPS export ABC transporter periplasmic protein LptC [Thermoanaerobaculia bacterium]
MKIRRSEILVLVSALAFAAVLVVSFQPGRRPSAHGRSTEAVPTPAGGARGQPTTLLDGFDFTEESGGKPQLRIKADRTVGYGPAAGLAPDLYAGEKVVLTLFPEDGNHPVTVHGDRGTYDERTREAQLEGNVHWNDDQESSMAETSQGFYRPVTRTLEAPHPVHFTRGSIELNAPSARYDIREKVLYLAGPLDGTGGGNDSAGLSKLTARSGLYRREPGVLELETVDARSTSGDRYAADHMTVKMGSSGGHTEWMHGVGGVHGILAPGRTTQSAPATPTAASTDAPQRQYSADESLLNFDAAGKPATLTLTGNPAVLWEPKQRLTAPKIEMTFSDGRLAAAKAWGGVRLEGATSRGQADHGSLAFSPEGGAQNVVLEGSVVVESEGRKGDGARAVELDDKGLWLLTGDETRAARVQSGADRLSADRIELDRPHQQVRGQGRARAVLGADAEKRERTVTFIGDPKRPSYGKADRIVLDDSTQLATLSGSASLWQDDSSLFADDITLSDVEKTVTAVQNVRAVLAPDKTPPKPAEKASRKPPPEHAASVVTSKRMVYKDSDRSGRFEGGVVVTRGTGWRATGGESTA